MRRRRHMKRVRAQTIADKLAVDFGVPFFCALEFFNNDHACSLADDKAVPIAVPRTRGTFRRVISGMKAFMAPKPAKPMGMIAASEPPAKKTSASPNLIIRHDSPMALLEVAQAVTMHMFGPRIPNSIEINPLAMLLMSMGMVKAETRFGPLESKMVY